MSEILKSDEIKKFLDENESSIKNITLTEYLEKLISEKGLKRNDVIKASELNYTYGYQILNGTRKPNKDKLLQLCIGLKATVKEANKILLLADAGGLYSKNRRDCVFIFALEKGLNFAQVNNLLYELGEKTMTE
jgi:hypothetical protein